MLRAYKSRYNTEWQFSICRLCRWYSEIYLLHEVLSVLSRDRSIEFCCWHGFWLRSKQKVKRMNSLATASVGGRSVPNALMTSVNGWQTHTHTHTPVTYLSCVTHKHTHTHVHKHKSVTYMCHRWHTPIHTHSAQQQLNTTNTTRQSSRSTI